MRIDNWAVGWALACFLGLSGQTPIEAASPEEIAVGEWSEPVADANGAALRGRLMICERRISDERREAAVYIELQDARESIGFAMRVFCDFSRHDFRPENESGLRCELRDSEGEVVPPKSFPFGGAVPASEWIRIPTDATIRLRVSPWGIYRPGARAIAPDVGTIWIIADGNREVYELSAKFMADREAEEGAPFDERVWRGTLKLPAVKLSGRMG